MYEEKYEEAINKLKEVYPQFKDVKFDISNGELGYISGTWSLIEKIDINELQKFVNSFLGQKVYRAEYISYVDVYARSEEEAKEFTRYFNPIGTWIKVNETDLEKINY